MIGKISKIEIYNLNDRCYSHDDGENTFVVKSGETGVSFDGLAYQPEIAFFKEDQ